MGRRRPGAPLEQGRVAPHAVELRDPVADTDDAEAAAQVECEARAVLGEDRRLERPDPLDLRPRDELLQQRSAHAVALPVRRNVDAVLDGPVDVAVEGPAQALAVAQVFLTWSSSSLNATALEVYRRDPGADWRLIAVLPPNTVGYTDRTVQPGTTYSYRVRAANNYFASGWSNVVSSTVPAGL